jgi:ActR/RegA family two-component response regulator
MLNFTPPPRQQVLYGIRVQAEQVRNLVEDLQAGSEGAVTNLLTVASQISARARMYQWPRLTIWSSALEERLAKIPADQTPDSADMQWLVQHVGRLDGVLSSPTGSEESGEARPLAEGGLDVFEGDEDSAEVGLDDVEFGSESDVEIKIDYDFNEERVTRREPGSADAPLQTPAPAPERDSADREKSTYVPGAAEPAFDTMTPVPGVVQIDEDGEVISDGDMAAGAAEPARSDRQPGEAEGEGDGKATLARLEIQKLSKSATTTNTEIQGPNQYIVVSVSADSELHKWLGRVLPERRFELLAARGAAEAEILCRNHQPDLVLVRWGSEEDLAQDVLSRIRENSLTSYVRVALVTDEDDLASHLAASRLGAVGLVPRSAPHKTVFSRVLLAVLSPADLPQEELGETSMTELSDLLLRELRGELDRISGIVGDVRVPVGGLLGQVLRETSRKLRDGVTRALGSGVVAPGEAAAGEVAARELVKGKTALVMEADRERRAELVRVLAELGLEVLPPMPDLTQALEAGLTWAPDVFIGGAPLRDSETCVQVLKRDIALSSLSSVLVSWPESTRQWPNAQADVAALRPWLCQRLASVFAPSADVRRRLIEHEEVTGRVESCGMLTFLRLALEHRSKALIEIAEGTDQFRAMIADGHVLDVIWTEADGTTTMHFEAFDRMLAVSRGRFFVRPLKGDLVEPALPGTLTELLTAACHWWRPLGLTVDQRLRDIGALSLDQRRTAEIKRQTGKLFRKVVSALAAGKTPVEIIDGGGVGEDVVAHVLRELVRRFAVKQLPTA